MSGQLQNGEQQFFDNNGKPLNGGTIDFYVPNTTTRKTTWQDQALNIQNTNPIILDGGGKAIIWGSGSYRQVLKDSHGNLIWDKVVADPTISLLATTGASQVGADDGTGGSIFTTIAGFISSVKSNIGSTLVGFIQSGIGSVFRTVQNKLSEHVSILDFGAVGDGLTNCTDSIRSALNSNQDIDIPVGTFVCGKTGTSGDFLLYLGTRNGLTISGRGPSSVLKLADNAGANTLLFGAASTDTIKNLVIRDLTFDLNGLNNLQINFNDPLRYNSAAYLHCYCENVLFENVTFINASGHQIIRVGDDTAANYGKNIRVKNCRFKNYGIGVPGSKTQDCSALYIQADGIEVTDNTFENDQFTFDPARGQTGAELHGDNSTVVSRNRFSNCQLPWIMASSQKATNNISISNNRYTECFYLGSLDGDKFDQKVIDVGPGEIFNSTKPTTAIFRVGNFAEVAKNRENVRFFGNQVMLWGDANQDTHFCDLSDCYIRSLEISDNHFGGLNGSIIYYSGTVRNSGFCDIDVHDNTCDSLGSTGGVYPTSPSFLHIETSSGAINTLNFSDNTLLNSSLKDYSVFGIVKLTGIINTIYVKKNLNYVSSAYPLTTGSPSFQYEDIDPNFPEVWFDNSSESPSFTSITSGSTINLYDFTSWTSNDRSAFKISVFGTDGGASFNGLVDYDVLICGSGNAAVLIANAGTYGTDITLQFSGKILQIKNGSGTTLFVRPTYSGHSSKQVNFLV